MKRFYKKAAVAAIDGGYAVSLDGRPMRTPGGWPWIVPERALAAAAADEWDGQGEDIAPDTMPLTQFVNGTLDRVAPRRDEVIDEIVGFGGSDLLCYRADGPEDLCRRQARAWQPLLEWAAQTHGVCLSVTRGVLPLVQPDDSLRALRRLIAAEHSDFELHALQTATGILGSAILGLAVVRDRLSTGDAFALSRLDEVFQEERWGSDAEAQRRTNKLSREMEAVGRFIFLLRGGKDL